MGWDEDALFDCPMPKFREIIADMIETQRRAREA